MKNTKVNFGSAEALKASQFAVSGCAHAARLAEFADFVQHSDVARKAAVQIGEYQALPQSGLFEPRPKQPAICVQHTVVLLTLQKLRLRPVFLTRKVLAYSFINQCSLNGCVLIDADSPNDCSSMVPFEISAGLGLELPSAASADELRRSA
jgi:hypothetical protein